MPCVLVAALACFPLFGAPASSAGENGKTTSSREEQLNDARRKAVKKGCLWISGRQNRKGDFGDYKGLVAITSLSALALMSDGSGVGRGPYGDKVLRAVYYLLEIVEKPSPVPGESFQDGYFREDKDGTSRMHGQGYAMLALASALGTADEDMARRIEVVLKKAVLVAERSQTQTGGWGYNPAPTVEHEGSVTVTIAQGLRAARDAGIKVSADSVKRGLLYLVKSQRNTSDEDDGSFKYSLTQERSTYALTAAALSSFFLFGEYGTDEESKGRISRAITYIKRKVASVSQGREWFYYGNFYAAWAAWQLDGNDPDPAPDAKWTSDPRRNDSATSKQFWGPWHSKMYPVILREQKGDGSWSDANDDHFLLGDLLPTAFAVLTLAIPDENIPVFQR